MVGKGIRMPGAHRGEGIWLLGWGAQTQGAASKADWLGTCLSHSWAVETLKL